MTGGAPTDADATGPAVVAAAQAGDEAARERLAAAYLPLVYNVVGRAMDGHPDVDDVVQETMLRVCGRLDGLRDPSSFRSWLVAVAMNEVRRRWAARQQAAVPGLDGAERTPDPAADFVDLTILRLGLSGQRREVAEATRWLDDRDRDLLSLWWLETAGELTRADLASALDLSPQHTAVRVQRMREQLESARVVVRALAAVPRCAELADLAAPWDGRPAALWRKRIARHARGCPACSGHRRGLMPAEGLLAGLGLLPAPQHLGGAHLAALPAAWQVPAPGGAGTNGAGTGAGTGGGAGARGPAPTGGASSGPTGPRTRRGRTGGRRTGRLVALAAGVLALSAAVPAVLHAGPDAPPAAPPPAPASPPTATPTAPVAASPLPSPPPAPPTVAPVPPTATAAVSTTAAPRSTEQQVTDLINTARAGHGCGALRIDPRLHVAAQKHSEDMAARHYYDHVTPEGTHADSRITAAGYRWSLWGENLDRGRKGPAQLVDAWTDGAIHQENMLDCRFTGVGLGSAAGPDGTLWTLDLAAPR
ncbi:sigma-70 family RNA polymerase sigma factor [Kitasatospora sp. NBC_00315]